MAVFKVTCPHCELVIRKFWFVVNDHSFVDEVYRTADRVTTGYCFLSLTGTVLCAINTDGELYIERPVGYVVAFPNQYAVPISAESVQPVGILAESLAR